MRGDLRQVLVIIIAMIVGAAGATIAVLGYGRPSHALGYGYALFAIGLWVRTLLLFAQGVDQENPSELATWVSASAGVTCLLADGLLKSHDGVWDWALVGAGIGLALACGMFKLRAITRKYENKRKAQGV